MNTSSIIEAIDKEIGKLQQARSILAGVSAPAPSAPASTGRRGRPKGSKKAVKSATVAVASAPVKAKRVLSAEGRARISAALKKRYAANKRAAKKAAAKQAA